MGTVKSIESKDVHLGTTTPVAHTTELTERERDAVKRGNTGNSLLSAQPSQAREHRLVLPPGPPDGLEQLR